MPTLMQFYDEFEKRRDDFEILALHDPQASSLADLDEKLQETRDEVWGGRQLPFPILMDETGETLERYGINAFPTILVFDTEGRLVRRGDLLTVREHLASRSEKARALRVKLQEARGTERFAPAVRVAVDAGGDEAVWALASVASTEANAKEMELVRRAIPEIGGPLAVVFLLGEHGLQSPEKERQLAAIEKIGRIADGRDTYLRVQAEVVAELDPAVLDALQAVLVTIGDRIR